MYPNTTVDDTIHYLGGAEPDALLDRAEMSDVGTEGGPSASVSGRG